MTQIVSRKPRIYIAGPYRKGGEVQNIRKAILAGRDVLRMGGIPFIPHLNGLWDMVSPENNDAWLEWDNAWLDVCDALYRLPGESVGSDNEMSHAGRLGIPVFLEWPDVVEFICIWEQA